MGCLPPFASFFFDKELPLNEPRITVQKRKLAGKALPEPTLALLLSASFHFCYEQNLMLLLQSSANAYCGRLARSRVVKFVIALG